MCDAINLIIENREIQIILQIKVEWFKLLYGFITDKLYT